MIDVPQHHLETVKKILGTYIGHCRVIAFGSRVSGCSKPYSDLDLAIYGTLPVQVRTMAKLKTEFSKSKLPFKVDVLDWHQISESFRAVINGKSEIVMEPD